MSDWSQLSLQDHELEYILKKFGKATSLGNKLMLMSWEKAFKTQHGGSHTKMYTKEEFYEYIKKNKDLSGLDDVDSK